ncbi:MAG: beta strand repeat-containing protein, partial [Prochlorococcus sp.]
MKSGVTGASTDSYSENYIFDDISNNFNGITKEFTLQANGSDITGVTTTGIILINDIWQERGTSSNYTLEESAGITSITFVGTSTALSYDVGISSYPVGGVIVSVGSTEGLGYQPLVAAGGTATVSTAGTVSTISIGNSGTGYRSGIGQTVNISIQQESLTGTDIVAIGTATIGSNGHITGVAVTNTHVFYQPKTITNVGYNSITGMSTVTTLTAHGLSSGNEVKLSGIAFTCTYSGSKSITGFAYSAASGIATITTSGAHGYSAGKDVIFSGIAMTCGLDSGASTHYYPRGEDPAYDTAISIASTTATTLTINVGYGGPNDQSAHTFVSATSGAVISGGDYTHQFVSAGSSAVIAGGNYTHTFVSVGVGTITVTGIGSTTPTDATYTASTGDLVLTVGSGHTFTTSDTVGIGTSALIFTCSMDNNATNHNYPRSTDPVIGVNTAITAITDSTITVNVGAADTVYYDISNATYHGTSGLSTITIGSHSLSTSTSIRLANNALTFRCSMDDYATLHTYPRSTDPGFSTSLGITTTTANTITVNVGASPLVYHNVSAADYSANVGVMTMTIGAHTLKTGNSIKLGTESLSFTCAKDSGVTTHRYPRKPDP